ncbi:hypothetical protein SKAU_G00401310 [Synaphobranchus kaupii]|uniref:Uncharacterized protein n=1 Tax=Synaphobranchus kaupii TaxID=118154 RepID=A0A9Q1E971_SYNKA|nr:hypothetical protein SKAU_G00401310 [Synaphobranchus kaupii]
MSGCVLMKFPPSRYMRSLSLALRGCLQISGGTHLVPHLWGAELNLAPGPTPQRPRGEITAGRRRQRARKRTAELLFCGGAAREFQPLMPLIARMRQGSGEKLKRESRLLCCALQSHTRPQEAHYSVCPTGPRGSGKFSCCLQIRALFSKHLKRDGYQLEPIIKERWPMMFFLLSLLHVSRARFDLISVEPREIRSDGVSSYVGQSCHELAGPGPRRAPPATRRSRYFSPDTPPPPQFALPVPSPQTSM